MAGSPDGFIASPGGGVARLTGPFISPVVLGGGAPYFPPLDQRLGLELLETRTFGSGVAYLRSRRTRGGQQRMS